MDLTNRIWNFRLTDDYVKDHVIRESNKRKPDRRTRWTKEMEEAYDIWFQSVKAAAWEEGASAVKGEKNPYLRSRND